MQLAVQQLSLTVLIFVTVEPLIRAQMGLCGVFSLSIAFSWQRIVGTMIKRVPAKMNTKSPTQTTVHLVGSFMGSMVVWARVGTVCLHSRLRSRTCP